MIKTTYKKIFPLRFRLDIYYFLFKIRYLFYIGKEFECNCCESKSRKFLDYGNPKRRNAACPYCNALERNRVLWFYMQDKSLLNRETKLLHFAPERIIEAQIKKMPLRAYISADIDKNLADTVVDITNIQFSDNSFNLLICSHVLAHIKDEAKAIKELYRVLSKDGQALIMTRIFENLDRTLEYTDTDTPAKRLQYYQQDDVYRQHGKDFQNTLAKAGFNVEVIDYGKALGEEMQLRYCLGKNELIYKCTKK